MGVGAEVQVGGFLEAQVGMGKGVHSPFAAMCLFVFHLKNMVISHTH